MIPLFELVAERVRFRFRDGEEAITRELNALVKKLLTAALTFASVSLSVLPSSRNRLR